LKWLQLTDKGWMCVWWQIWCPAPPFFFLCRRWVSLPLIEGYQSLEDLVFFFSLSPCCFFLRWLLLRLWTFEFLCTPFSFPPLYFSLSLFLHFLLLFFLKILLPFPTVHPTLPFLSPYLHSPCINLSLYLFFNIIPLFICCLEGGKTLCLFWSLFPYLIFISLANFFCFFYFDFFNIFFFIF
jgi:hypothetical protein